jgi:hypothetical protein
MGAEDDKTKTTKDEPLDKEELNSLLAVGANISRAIAALDDAGIETRELGLVLVNLEQSEMWLDRAFEEMGYEPAEEPDDEGDGDDDEDDEGEGEEE